MPPSDANVSLDASHSVFLYVDTSTRDAHDHVHAHLANVPLSDADISLDVTAPTRAAECMGKIEAGLVKDPVAQRACVVAMLRRFES